MSSARSAGGPTFEIPCSRRCVPLAYGVGVTPRKLPASRRFRNVRQFSTSTPRHRRSRTTAAARPRQAARAGSASRPRFHHRQPRLDRLQRLPLARQPLLQPRAQRGPSHRRAVASRVTKSARNASRTPCVASNPRSRFRTRVRSARTVAAPESPGARPPPPPAAPAPRATRRAPLGPHQQVQQPHRIQPVVFTCRARRSPRCSPHPPRHGARRAPSGSGGSRTRRARFITAPTGAVAASPKCRRAWPTRAPPRAARPHAASAAAAQPRRPAHTPTSTLRHSARTPHTGGVPCATLCPTGRRHGGSSLWLRKTLKEHTCDGPP